MVTLPCGDSRLDSDPRQLPKAAGHRRCVCGWVGELSYFKLQTADVVTRLRPPPTALNIAFGFDFPTLS
jgi:hypothetical protein